MYFSARQEPSEVNVAETEVIESCPLNITPSIFLYPAINSDSSTPEFFNDTEYEIFVTYSPVEPDFNTSITCGFFDEEWFIQNHEIKRGFSDWHNNNVGNKDIIFNFTLQYKN